MRRRAFISLLSGAAAWSLAARAQQAARVRRIGVLLNITADDPQSQARLAAFAQGLQQLGWTIGQNVLVDYRWGRGDAEAMRTHAAELVALGPDIILAHSSAALAPLLQVTRTVPIVFTIVADPVGAWVPLLRLRATHYHTVAQERCCASQQKLRADVACGSWPC
jgi:putative tryptophan/tyrosine transport system substrate-binding protein